jgi:hypothetical protein
MFNQELDLLVRTSRQNDIVQCLLTSGCWVMADHKESDNGEPVRQVPRLKRLGQDFHILLWSENFYNLEVDGELCEVPHICAWNAVLAEPQFYHPPPPHIPAHHVLPNPGVVCVPRTPDQTPPPGRPKRTPIFIPTIPRYINSCLMRMIIDDSTPYTFPVGNNPRHDISYLIRFLFLEMDDQRAKFLPMLPGEHQKRMEQMLNRYIRTSNVDLLNGWDHGKGGIPFLRRMKEKKGEPLYPLWSIYYIAS